MEDPAKKNQFWIIDASLLRNGPHTEIAYASGERTYEFVSVQTGMSNDAVVLDFGCGDGRVGSAFARKKMFRGQYHGLDIHKDRIGALNELFAPLQNFHFHHADVFHSYYNKEGKLNPAQYEYPFLNDFFDVAFYSSVFTHMDLGVALHHLEQCFLHLKPGGKVWASFYVIDKYYNTEYSLLNWRFETPFGEGYTATPANPEGCVGYKDEKVFQLFKNANLEVERFVPGYWKMPRTSQEQSEQDIIIARKP